MIKKDLIDPITEAIKEDNCYKLDVIVEYLDNKNALMHLKLPLFGDTEFTLLHYCFFYGSTNCIEMLCQMGADINAKDNSGRTCAHYAAAHGSLDVFNKIPKEQYEAEDNKGLSPVHYAAIFNSTDIIKFLNIKGCKITEITDKKKRTPFQLAILYGNLKVVEYYIENHIEQAKSEIVNSLQPIHIACKCIYKASDVIKYLIEKGAKIDVVHNYKTPLCYASKSGNLDVVKILINNGAKYQNEAMNPITSATLYGHRDILKYLLRNGFSPNDYGDHEEPPLLVALKQENLEIAYDLLEYGSTACQNNGNRIESYFANYKQKNIREIYDIFISIHKFADINSSDELIQASRQVNPNIMLPILKTVDLEKYIEIDEELLNTKEKLNISLAKKLNNPNKATQAIFMGNIPKLRSSCEIYPDSKIESNEEEEDTDDTPHDIYIKLLNLCKYAKLPFNEKYLNPSFCRRYILCNNAIHHGSLNVLQALLESNLYPPDSTDLYIEAFRLGRFDLIDCMLSNGVSFNSENSELYRLVVNSNCTDIIQKFVQKGMHIYQNDEIFDSSFFANNVIDFNF